MFFQDVGIHLHCVTTSAFDSNAGSTEEVVDINNINFPSNTWFLLSFQ
jgi:hypothetical protein